MQSSSAARFKGYCRGMGIGGWLTNYKRFNVLPQEWRMPITIGDMEHFETYITRDDVQRIASFGMDHIRLAFDQIVLEEAENPGVFRENILELIDRFIFWCEEAGINVVLNLHKAIGNYCDIRENWMRDVISLLKAHGIPYCVWNYLSTPNDGNRFSLVDDDHRNILSPELLKIIQGNVD